MKGCTGACPLCVNMSETPNHRNITVEGGEEIKLFGSGGGERERKELGIFFLRKIPINPQTRVCADQGRPILLDDPEVAVSQVFSAIASRIEEALAEKVLKGER